MSTAGGGSQADCDLFEVGLEVDVEGIRNDIEGIRDEK
jgi:hypothetical protein